MPEVVVELMPGKAGNAGMRMGAKFKLGMDPSEPPVVVEAVVEPRTVPVMPLPVIVKGPEEELGEEALPENPGSVVEEKRSELTLGTVGIGIVIPPTVRAFAETGCSKSKAKLAATTPPAARKVQAKVEARVSSAE